MLFIYKRNIFDIKRRGPVPLFKAPSFHTPKVKIELRIWDSIKNENSYLDFHRKPISPQTSFIARSLLYLSWSKALIYFNKLIIMFRLRYTPAPIIAGYANVFF